MIEACLVSALLVVIGWFFVIAGFLGERVLVLVLLIKDVIANTKTEDGVILRIL